MKINRREERKTQRRASILEVARRSFFEKGYAATTMSGIAATLGGSKSTLWRYFSSKEELFAAVLDDATAEFKRELGELLLSHQGVRNTLMRLCLHFIEKLVDPRSIRLHRLIHGEGGRFPEIGLIFYERAPKNVEAILAAYLDHCIQEGSIRKVDTMIAAGNLIAVVMSGTHQKMLLNVITEATSADIRADAENAVGMFMRAYGTGDDDLTVD